MLPPPLRPETVLPWEKGLAPSPAEADLPVLSLVIPIRNAGRFLERTLRSLAGSDLSGVEVIVMDGASTDETPDILEHYRGLLDVVHSEPDSGQSGAINKGMARAGGALLGWLNGDDVLLPDALTTVRRAARDTGADVLVGDAALTEGDLSITHLRRFTAATLAPDILLDWADHHLIQPSVFFSRRAWQDCGPAGEDLHYAMDADLFLAMARRFPLVHVPETLAYSVYHEAAKTRAKRAESLAELALVQARHGGFAEARRTLGLLVDLYNRAVASGAGGPTQAEDVCARRLAAAEAEAERNRRLLLALDLDLGRGDP